MNLFPNNKEIEQAVDLLVNKYNLSTQLLNKLFNLREHINELLKELDNRILDRAQLARLLVIKKGPMLFSGSTTEIRELRKQLLRNLPKQSIEELFIKHIGNEKNAIKNHGHMIRPLSEKKWHPGKSWAKDFVRTTGFPLIFAGVKEESSANSREVIDVSPRIPVPPLVSYQIEVKNKMLEVLECNGDKTKCMVTIPTGGGKTRVAVEAFIQWMMPRFAQQKYLVWIAQSEELCEQAIKCIEQLWQDKEFSHSLRIYRYFGGRDLKEDDLIGGVVVASINQLHHRIKSEDEVLFEILKNTGSMIIDEAHRAVSSMYDQLLDTAEQICGEDLFPICGLTATPGRAGINRDDEISKLVNRFDTYLIKPFISKEFEHNPLEYFREHKFLARANHINFKSGLEFAMTEEEFKQPVEYADEMLKPGFLKRMANSKPRNIMIIERLLRIPKKMPTLVYACSVEHAELLSVILAEKGRTTGLIIAKTPLTIRRGLIEDFKKRKIDFLCNFGVLTTGFDAPLTEYIAICRPTTSAILYEQIVGRGLRGPAFGGTAECTIIDFTDNIHRFGDSMAYARFSNYWTSDVEENQDTYNCQDSA